MQFKNYNIYFFFLVLIGVSILTYLVVEPFIISFLIAAILAHLFSPVYRFFLKYFKSKGLSSLATCFFIALIIVIPAIIVLSLVINELQNTIGYFNQNPDVLKNNIIDIRDKVSNYPLIRNLGFSSDQAQDSTLSAIKSLSQSVLSVFQNVYSSVVHFIFVTFIMFFSLFYLLIDGSTLVKKIMKLSPLKEKYEIILIEKFNSITRATIKGTTLIAMLQGALSGLLFFSTGVPSPALLGILSTIASTIPSVGAGLIWLSVAVLMAIFGFFPQALIILIGGLLISTIDNFIRPRLVGTDTQMHPLLILFSTLGGIVFFGFSGFIVGPIIMSLFVSLWDIYALEFKSQLEKYN
jgi:predicted PurR-regulated permease PerM